MELQRLIDQLNKGRGSTPRTSADWALVRPVREAARAAGQILLIGPDDLWYSRPNTEEPEHPIL